MDLAKLDKMKVVDLRNELQTRGLDTKGVKAVLIERLRAHVEGSAGGGDGDGAPLTPSRRQRRTRSMSRSPSPVAAAPVATEPVLETLPEEDQATAEPEVEAEAGSGPEVEEVEEEEQEQEQEQEEEDNKAVQEEVSEETDASAPQAEQDEDVAMADEAAAMETADQEDSNDTSKQVEKDEDPQQNDEASADADTDKVAHQSNGDNGEKMEVDDEAAAAKTDKEEDKEQDQEKTNERRKRSHSHTRSRSSSRSPKRRSGDKRDSKSGAAAEERTVAEDEPTMEENQVGLSWFDSDLHLRIDATTFTSAKPLNSEIYSLIWSGARANYGVREGKVCFEVQLSEESVPENSHHFRDEPHVRGFRVGFSTPQTPMLLGEAEHSYGYCESGRKANNGEFKDYGKPYQLDDVIGCYLDLDSTPCNIKYTLNGEDLGIAHEFDKSILGEEGALFPHILTKGYEYTVNFANNEELLVNAERPTRKRRKQRAESHKDDDNDVEKWKVLDEATADDDEPEKKDDDAKPAATEQSEVADKPEPPNADATSDAAEEEQTKEAGVEGETQSEQAESAEAAQDQAMEPVEEAAEAPAVEATEPAAVANGDSLPEAEKATENSEHTAEPEASVKESAKDSESAANAQEDDEDGPSPNKRAKADSETDKSSADKSHPAEEEYEDVVPVPRDTVALLPGYVLLALVPTEKLVSGPQCAASRKECEVILLVGLPGAGKTHWTQKHVAENVDKRYEIIGPDSIIAKMTIDGESRKTVHKGRWDKVYEICLNSLGGLEDIAMKRRRNFILDQPISRFPHWSLAGLTTSSTRS
ncbi:heterogeneous nuclear ribonucleoprotein U isoform X3 [Drosophila virilis]|uniref:heterogeneous nuclear ribonucleoprotein U isoform X3 n=1 Tax=Drosophila virilis TaxID=7244 RepID=UPI001396324A|nr:heterogeneous nuclear ribonucleoprotein U-like protein 1 isoform X3 [Drosophila virilis]